MIKAKLKEQMIEWIDFDKFIDEIKKTTEEPHWTGRFRGYDFTHEHNQCYLITDNSNQQIRFNKGEALIILENGKLITVAHPLFGLLG